MWPSLPLRLLCLVLEYQEQSSLSSVPAAHLNCSDSTGLSSSRLWRVLQKGCYHPNTGGQYFLRKSRVVHRPRHLKGSD